MARVLKDSFKNTLPTDRKTKEKILKKIIQNAPLILQRCILYATRIFRGASLPIWIYLNI